MCIRDRSWTPANTPPASATATKTSQRYPWSGTTSTATGTTPCSRTTRRQDEELFRRGPLATERHAGQHDELLETGIDLRIGIVYRAGLESDRTVSRLSP